MKTKPNYIYAIVSVALVLFLIGLFGMIILHAQKLIRNFKEEVNIMAELQESASAKNIRGLFELLKEQHYIKSGSVDFISKTEAAQIMKDDFGDDFMNLDLPNPLHDVITFNLKAAYMQADSLALISQSLQANPLVLGVYYQQNLIESIEANLQKVGWGALIIGLFFIVVAVSLINNTIKLSLYANRFIIKNMELVGASWGFISRPYLLKSIKNGLYSALLAILALVGLGYIIELNIPGLYTKDSLTDFTFLFVSILLGGILITGASTYYVVNKYLKMRLDDLY